MGVYQWRNRRNEWWIEFVYRGQRTRLRSPLQHRRGAEAYERKLRAEQEQAAATGVGIQTGRAPRFADFAERWMRDYAEPRNRPATMAAKRQALNCYLLARFGALRLDEIGAANIAAFVSELRQKGLSNKTTNNILTMLRQSLAVAAEWGLIRASPRVPHLPVPEASFRYLTEVEEFALLNATPAGFWHAFVLLLLRTGLRFSEGAALRWSDLTLTGEHPFAHICRGGFKGVPGPTKSGRVRDVPLARELIAELDRLPRSHELVFPQQAGRPMMSTASKVKYIYRFCRDAGIERGSWHALRHTFGTRLATRGVPVPVVQKLMGHANIKMTMRYVHVDTASIFAAVAAIERPLPTAWPLPGTSPHQSPHIASRGVPRYA